MKTYVVAVPCNDVEGAVVLLALEELATELVHNLPWVVLGDLVVRNWAQEVPCVGQTVCTQRSQLWKLVVRTPNLQNVTPGGSLDVDLEALSALDDADLTRLHVHHTEFGLNVQSTLLWDDEEITVAVDEGSLLHGLVGGEKMGSDTLTKGWVTGTGNCAESINEIVLLLWNVEWKPCELGRRNMDAWVHWEEVGLGVLIVREVGLPSPLSANFPLIREMAFWRMTYEALVSNSRPGAVQPRLLVLVSGSNEGGGGHLLSVETEANIAWAVLALRDGAWDSFGLEAGETRRLEWRTRGTSVGAVAYWLLKPAWYYRRVSSGPFKERESIETYLVRVVLPGSKGWDLAILLRLCPAAIPVNILSLQQRGLLRSLLEDLLVLLGVLELFGALDRHDGGLICTAAVEAM